MESMPKLQLVFNLSLSLMFSVWVLLAKPFKTRIENFLLCLNEICFVIVICFCTVYIEESRPPDLALTLGWIIIAVVVGCVLTNCVLTLIMQA